MAHSFKVLIVEDELLIARSLERYLLQKGYQVVGIAISYEEATALYQTTRPDLSLLDIRLNGTKTGIDVAHFINQETHSTPFLYLTSQIDRNNLAAAKATFPTGYLTKPVQKESLYATIEVAMFKYFSNKKETANITVFDGTTNHNILLKDILFLQSEHIYVQIHLKNNQTIVPRISLKDLLAKLPENQFIQTHRSFAINLQNVSSWDNEHIYLQEKTVPVSRSRKKAVLSYLKK